MTPTEAYERFRISFMRARRRTLELGLEDMAELISPWLFSPNHVGRAIQVIDQRGAESVTFTEVMNLLIIADREPVLCLSCSLEGLPTADEWIQTGAQG